MTEPKINNYFDMRVIMRKDFYEKFGEHLKKMTEDTGATYYTHNIIKNYREAGHTISTFCNRENWHEIYWDKYRSDDPLEAICHQAVQKNNFAVLSWEIGQQSHVCGQERKKITGVKDGILFSFKRPGNYFETFLIGWDDLDTEKLDEDYITHLSSLLKPLRDYHWDVHNKI